MAHHKDNMIWWVLGGAAVAYYFYQNGTLQNLGLTLPATPTPLSIYPEYAYTASMAASPTQQPAQAIVMPTPAFTAVQGQEYQAVMDQCAGSYPGCTVLMGDTQLGI